MSIAGNVVFVVDRPILPGDPPQVCPDIMTPEEAIRFLRLDEAGLNDPQESLDRLRRQGKLNGIQFTKRIFYRRVDLETFANSLAEHNPR